MSYEYVTSAERLGAIANEVDNAKVVGLDIETTSLDPRDGKIRLLQLNTGQGIYVIDLFKTCTMGPLVEALKGSAIKVIQNAKFEQKWLLFHHGIELWPVFDTFRASAIIHNGRFLGNNLYDLYARELKVEPGTGDMGGSDWSAAELGEEQLDYAAEDVTYLLELRDALKPKLAKAGLNRIALIEFGAPLAEAEIELNGFRLDSEMWLKVAEANKRKLEELRNKLDVMLPHPKGLLSLPGIPSGFNYRSPQQVLASFNSLTKPNGKPLNLGLTSTASDLIAMIATKHKVFPLFIEYRKISKRVDSFGPDYLENINPKTGRIHTDFWPLTGAGRYSCVVGETLIRTTEGMKRMEDVSVGDQVWTHKERWQPVINHWRLKPERIYSVRFSNGEVLKCTGSHRLLLSTGEWKSVRSMVDECIKDLDRGREESSGCSGTVPEPGDVEAYRGCREAGDYVSQRVACGTIVYAGGRAQGVSSSALLGIKDGGAESYVGQEGGATPQLEGVVRRRLWVSDLPAQWQEAIRSSRGDGRSVGLGGDSRALDGPSHRRGSEEQRSAQPRAGDSLRPQGYSLQAAEGQQDVTIEEVYACGSREVYDITVAVDESYEACGVFSHNSRSPNLQQIPRAFEYRDCFRPGDGRILIVTDYCVVGGTRVATSEGLVPVENVAVGAEVLVEDGTKHRVSDRISKGVQSVYRIRTKLGYELRATSLHRIRVLDREGAYVWKRLHEIGPSDYVAVQSGRGLSEASSKVVLPPKPSGGVNSKEVRVPGEVSEDLAFFVGYFVGDGNLGSNYLRWVVNAKDPAVHERLLGLCEELFGLRDLHVKEYRGVIETHVNRKQLRDWFVALGVSKGAVPGFLWSSPPRVVGAFLRGLFEADGSAGGDHVKLVSSRRRLIVEVQQLLLALGVLSTRRKERHGEGRRYVGWSLRVPRLFLSRFVETVGFFSWRKQGKLSGLIGRGPVSPTVGSVPNMQERVRELRLEGEVRRLLNNTASLGRSVSFLVAVKLREEHPEVYRELGLSRTVEDGTFFDAVDSIELDGEEDVYDLSVPGPVTYISDGFVSHNSQIELRLAAEVTQDPVLIGIYLRGEDAHRRTASIVAGVPYDEVTKAQRQAAKPVNFGLIYGLGAAKLVVYSQANYGVTITEAQANKFIKRYFDGYPRVRAWQERSLRDAKRVPYARTLWGRRRYLDPETARNEYFNCLDFETEALTRRGWVRGPDLALGDEILTKNPKTGALEWQAPTDLRVFEPVERELTEFKSKSFHAVSTADHRWLVYNKGARKDMERRTSTLSRHGDDRIHRTGRYEGPESSLLSDDFVELAGWWLTDGGIQKTRRVYDRPGKRGPKPSGVSLKLYQSVRANPYKVACIEALLGRLGMRYSKSENGEAGGRMWYFRHPLNEVLVQLCPGRVLTMDLLNLLTARQCRLLLQTMIGGDGWRSDKTAFVSRSREGAEVFQILCTLCGYVGSIKKRDMRKYRPRSPKLKNVPKGTEHWQVTVLNRDKAQVLKKHVRQLKGVFGIWCPIVPNTFFVARRSGHVFITGNTPIQGSGADGLKRSLRNVYFRLKRFGSRAKMVHMVHDEIVVECDDDEELVAQVKLEVEQAMIEGIQPMMRSVPCVAEGDTGRSWAAH